MKSSKEKLLGTLFLLSAGNCVMAQERPNIVFILTDDQPYSLLHCTGNKLIQTPNLDKLAKEGVLFTNARFFVKFGGNLFFISMVFLFFFLNPIKSCRYVCFLVTLKTPHH